MRQILINETKRCMKANTFDKRSLAKMYKNHIKNMIEATITYKAVKKDEFTFDEFSLIIRGVKNFIEGIVEEAGAPYPKALAKRIFNQLYGTVMAPYRESLFPMEHNLIKQGRYIREGLQPTKDLEDERIL